MNEHVLGSAILLRAVLDLKSADHAKDVDFQSVERWAGNFPSRDFRLICALAGLEADAAHERIIQIIESKLTEFACQKQKQKY